MLAVKHVLNKREDRGTTPLLNKTFIMNYGPKMAQDRFVAAFDTIGLMSFHNTEYMPNTEEPM
jgi:hypothetical protein